jgi:hypothetical protein
MKKSDTATLLAFCAAFDQRTIGEADVLAWTEALSSPWVPNMGLEEAQAAVIEHYRGTSARIAPADVLKRVKDARAMAMSQLAPKEEGVPPNEDWLQARAELNAHLATRQGRRPSSHETAQAQVAESRQQRHAELDGAS